MPTWSLTCRRQATTAILCSPGTFASRCDHALFQQDTFALKFCRANLTNSGLVDTFVQNRLKRGARLNLFRIKWETKLL